MRLTTGAAAASIVAVIGLIWTVSQLYGALDVAFARIYSDNPERDIVRRTARGFAVVGILAAIILGFIVAATLATTLDSVGGIDIPLASSMARIASSIPFLCLVAIGAVYVVYRALPPRRRGAARRSSRRSPSGSPSSS